MVLFSAHMLLRSCFYFSIT